ncbi:MAG: 30S ribosomal protein S5 [Parcubacteria group bacterium]|nr:30S ribosomal protein S5 [Parcubacteria group bacterium]
MAPQSSTQRNASRRSSGVPRAGDGNRPRHPRGGAGRGGMRRGGMRGEGRSRERARPEFAQKVINVRRVARVVAGGRRFSFSVVVIIGNKKGSVGVGIGKGADTAIAIEKATREAKKHLIIVHRTKSNSIPHEVEAKYSSAVVRIIPVRGKGLVAGSSVRTVLDLAGVTDVIAKIMSRSKNKLNNSYAALKALGTLAK